MSRAAGLRSVARFVGCAAVGLALGCRAVPPATPPTPPPVLCDAIPAVAQYLEAASQRIVNAPPFGELDAREQVTLAIRFQRDGALRETRVVTASSEAAGAIVQRAAADAAPFGPPPHAGCLVKRESLVTLVSLGPRCDESRAADYMNAVAARVLERLAADEYATRLGTGRVVLDVTLEETGVLRSAEVVRADDAPAGEKATAAAREIAIFPPLAPEIYGCTNRGSFNVWLTVPGTPGVD